MRFPLSQRLLPLRKKFPLLLKTKPFFLLFLYRDVLRIDLPKIENVFRAKRTEHIPVMFAPKETKLILANLSGVPFLAASLLYGAGLRLTEALRLHVKDVNFESMQISVRDGKGAKDRSTLIKANLSP